MGAYIYLDVNINTLSQDEWEPIYKRSLEILEQFPIPLMRYDYQVLGGKFGRHSYVSDIVCSRGLEKEFWRINGDSISGEHAEDARLYRSLRRNYEYAGTHQEPEKDILWSTDPNDSSDAGQAFFKGKTSGCPYLMAIHLIGMFIETRLPGRAYVFGDIGEDDSIELQDWARAALGEELDIPVIFNGKKLWSRLLQAYETREAAMERFQYLYEGNQDEKKLFFSLGGKELVREAFMADRENGKDLIGNYHLTAMISLLENMHTVLDIFRREKVPDNRYDKKTGPKKILSELCKGLITFPYSERDVLKNHSDAYYEFRKADGDKSELMADALGTYASIELHIPAPELLEKFVSYAPEQKIQFHNIIQQYERKYGKILEDMAAETEKMNAFVKSHVAAPEQKEEETTFNFNASEEDQRYAEYIYSRATRDGYIDSRLRKHPAPIIPEAKPLIEYAYYKVQRYMLPEKKTRDLALSLQATLEPLEKEKAWPFNSEDPQQYRFAIYAATESSGYIFSLREASWALIDAEQNVTLLKHLLALCLMEETDWHLSQFKLYVLEHKELWPLLEVKNREHY